MTSYLESWDKHFWEEYELGGADGQIQEWIKSHREVSYPIFN